MKCKDGKIPWLAGHFHFFSVSFCPSPSPASSLAPREKQGPSFLPKLPKSSAMYCVDTNKIEETITSSRLSPVKSDKRGRSALSFSAPCRLLFAFSTPRQPGPSRVGEMQTNFLIETLPGWTERSSQEVPQNCVSTLLPLLLVQSPTLFSSSNSHALPLQGLSRPTLWSISKQ